VGKIVKEARFVDGRYVVEVPRVEGGIALDEVAAPQTENAAVTKPSRNGHTDRIALPEPPAAATPAIDWEQLRVDAEAIVDRAAADAEQIIRQAQTRAREIVAAAQTEAARLHETARAEGREQGYGEGKQAGEDELAPVITTIRELIESIRIQRNAAIMATEPELARLAMAVAERIVHSELQTNANVVAENVRQALTRLVSREVVTLRVNPVDIDTIRAHRDAIVAAGDVEHLRVVEDQRVDRGGVVVETEAGTIDSKVGTQLREARRAILGEAGAEDEIALGDAETLRPPAQAS
jgi:flagellar assembly protein FliH